MSRPDDGWREKQGLEVRSARDGTALKGWLDSGNYALNWAVSGRLLRGYPLGHTVEIFGDPSTRKSFLVAGALAMAQAVGGVGLLDVAETPGRFQTTGASCGTIMLWTRIR